MGEVKKIPTREEVEVKNTWALEDLYATDEDWEEDVKRAEEFGKKLSGFQGKLGESGKQLLGFYRTMDETSEWLELTANYAMRKSDQDTANGHYQDYASRIQNVFVSVSSAMSFFSPELMAIEEETLERFYKEEPELEMYREAIHNERRRKEHILSAETEALLASAQDMASQPDNIFGMLDNADLKFESVKDAQGKEYPVTHGNFVPLLESQDRDLRKAVFQSVYKTYKQFSNTYAAILSAQVKQLRFFATARKYSSTLEASLDASNVPVSVYQNLIGAVHANMDKMHKYVTLRKKLMGYDELHFYDVYAPLTGESSRKIPYEEAKETILKALEPLGEEYLSVLKGGFDNRWVDVYENKGKRSGAYSAGTKVHPYVLMNYADTLDSEFTLAHEMGHAMHSYLSNKNQPTVYTDYVTFVAEIASTCNEALLMQYLLGQTTDKKERAVLINHFLEQFKGTVYRQTMFAEFEMLINQMSERGETLTAEVLCKTYEDLQKLYFGEDMVVDDEIRYEWCRIPHFYYNFYVFQYATGFSAAIALSRKILKEGKPAVEKYLKFLSGGCSKDPISLLKEAGVDMTTAEPINEALNLFGELIDEMEKLRLS